MALDDLKETIETLSARIQAHRAHLEGNETRTRQALIDPMLHSLGWDVEDPNSVELEYGIDRKWADYALMGSERPIAVIEAKALGKPQEAATPVVIEKLTHDESAPTISEASRKKKVAESSKNGDWVPLMSLEVEAGTGQKPPAYIKFPDSSTKPLKNWVDLWVSVANYLIDTGKISAEHCPVPLREGSKRHLLHTEPIHSTGKEFHNKRKIGKLWLNTDFTSTDVHKHSCWLLDKFGVNPSTVLVSTNPS